MKNITPKKENPHAIDSIPLVPIGWFFFVTIGMLVLVGVFLVIKFS